MPPPPMRGGGASGVVHAPPPLPAEVLEASDASDASDDERVGRPISASKFDASLGGLESGWGRSPSGGVGGAAGGAAAATPPIPPKFNRLMSAELGGAQSEIIAERIQASRGDARDAAAAAMLPPTAIGGGVPRSAGRRRCSLGEHRPAAAAHPLGRRGRAAQALGYAHGIHGRAAPLSPGCARRRPRRRRRRSRQRRRASGARRAA